MTTTDKEKGEKSRDFLKSLGVLIPVSYFSLKKRTDKAFHRISRKKRTIFIISHNMSYALNLE